jgi:predicted nucleic acid-binding protein
MKLRVYLDTSVFSAYFDDRVTDRQRETHAFWARLSEFDIATSDLARRELEQAPEARQRRRLLGLLKGFTIHAITDEMERVADYYVEAGVFTITMRNDALHVAAAVLTRQDILLSWNFRHLVNRTRRAKINETNAFRGLPAIEILAPPEL